MKRVKFKRPSRRVTVVFAFISLAIITLGVMSLLIVKKSDAPSPSASQNSSDAGVEQTDSSTVSLLATGDWIAHDAINASAKSGEGYDYSSMTTEFKETFEKSDLNFCNLATMAAGEQFGISGYPSFNAPLEWNRDMARLGCNIINTGTNHTNDKGQSVINANLDYLDSTEGLLAVAGANRSIEEQNKVRYFEKKGVKFAFVSYSTYSNSPNPNPYSLNRFNEPLVSAQMNEATQNADIVIASMRWGTEYSDSLDSTQKSSAKKLADLGADIVLGHGTHTLQPVEKLQQPDGGETIVWYGLGNFLNAQLEVGGLTGCVADIKIDVATKKVVSNQCLPFYMHYEWSAEDKAAERLLKRTNFSIMPLNSADNYMPKSQLGTTKAEQLERIGTAINSLSEVGITGTNGN